MEFTFFQVMRRDAGANHVDRDSTPGTRGGHCAVYRWKALPDSDGRIQQFDSDGFMTRISMSHCPTDPNTP